MLSLLILGGEADRLRDHAGLRFMQDVVLFAALFPVALQPASSARGEAARDRAGILPVTVRCG